MRSREWNVAPDHGMKMNFVGSVGMQRRVMALGALMAKVGAWLLTVFVCLPIAYPGE